MSPLIILVWAAIIAGVIGFMVYSIAKERKRREEISKFAAGLGLTAYPMLSAADQALFDRFGFSQKGHSRKPSNVILADSGDLRMLLFDYSYATGGGKSRRTHQQTVAVASSGSIAAPDFQVYPEGAFQWLSELFGGKDIDFNDDPEFSRTFVLKGSDEVAIREYFTPIRRRAVMELGKIHLEAHNEHFMLTRPGMRLPIEQLPALMEQMLKLNRVLSQQ